ACAEGEEVFRGTTRSCCAGLTDPRVAAIEEEAGWYGFGVWRDWRSYVQPMSAPVGGSPKLIGIDHCPTSRRADHLGGKDHLARARADANRRSVQIEKDADACDYKRDHTQNCDGIQADSQCNRPWSPPLRLTHRTKPPLYRTRKPGRWRCDRFKAGTNVCDQLTLAQHCRGSIRRLSSAMPRCSL